MSDDPAPGRHDRLIAPESADDVRATWCWWSFGRRVSIIYLRLRYRMRTARGKANVPRSGAVLVVSNHMTGNDPFLVGSGIPRCTYYMAKSELFDHRVQGRLLGRVGAFPVRRGQADLTAIRIARGLLARGECVVMFPEGTRSRDERLRSPYPGAALLGLPDDVTVIPVAIWGIQHRRGPARVIFGPPVSKEGLEGSRSDRAGELALRMMAAIADLLPGIGGPRQEPPTTLAMMGDE